MPRTQHHLRHKRVFCLLGEEGKEAFLFPVFSLFPEGKKKKDVFYFLTVKRKGNIQS